MRLAKYSEVLFGVSMSVFGTFYLVLTTQLPRKGTIDSTFFPYILAAAIIVLGLLQIVQGIKLTKKFSSEEQVKEELDYFTVLKILSLIVIYIAILKPIGFLISTIVFLFLGFILLSPPGQKKNYGQFIVIAVITASITYFAFRNGLNLMLPEGILG